MKTTKARKRKRAAAVACTDLLACLDEIDKRAGERDADATALKAEGKELDAAWHGGVAIGLREACDKVRQIIQANTGTQRRGAKDA